MRFLAVLFTLAMTPLSGTAGALSDIPPDFYKSESATSIDECGTICLADNRCKGYTVLIPDTSKNLHLCYFFDGNSEQSLVKFPPPEPLNLDLILSDLNDYRAQHGLSPVTLNQQLISSSLKHAEDMAGNDMVEHVGTDNSAFTDRMEANGYNSHVAGENIAGGQAAWDQVFKDWQESPGHNATLLLSDAREFGIAQVYNNQARYSYYWAMLMASPLSDLYTE